MKLSNLLFIGIPLLFFSCKKDDCTKVEGEESAQIELKDYSVTPNFLKLSPGFSNVKIYSLLSSEDVLDDSPNFVYGSMADGAGLLKNSDGTFSLLNNIEADYAVARITLDKNFQPIKGEYILNSDATANTAQCSGSLITPEVHGFGPYYLSGGEWGGTARNVFLTDPYKDVSSASSGTTLENFGSWTVENAVVLPKVAYDNKTVALIGDDSHGDAGGALAMYVSETTGDLNNGSLYALKADNGELDLDLTVDTPIPVTFVEIEERTYDNTNAECIAKGVFAFNRVEDIDFRKGSNAASREIYFNATGKTVHNDTRTKYGRTYKLVLNQDDPTKGMLTLVLDGDNLTGKARTFHSPDNIVVTENYAYVQEDPNGYDDAPDKAHDARVYQYNLTTGEVKTVLEVDQHDSMVNTMDKFGNPYASMDARWGKCELTGMIDISDEIGIEGTFLLILQGHTWKNDAFLNPDGAGSVEDSSDEGSIAYIVSGLER